MSAGLDSKMQRFLKQSYKRGLGNIHNLSTKKMRDFLIPARSLHYPVKFKDHYCDNGCVVRQYYPNKNPHHVKPAVIYLPANGFFIDRLGLNDDFCYLLANELNQHVLAIYPPLVPEYRFPKYVVSTYETMLEIYHQPLKYLVDPKSLCFWGESSGANIGLSCNHMLKEYNLSIFKHQIIFYPMTDAITPFKSKQQFGYGYAMDAKFVEWILSRVCGKNQQKAHPMLSPNLFKDFSNMPPSTVLLAGYDYFKDEGLSYAHKLKSAGNRTQIKIFPSMIHGFMRFFPKHEITWDAFNYACNEIRQA